MSLREDLARVLARDSRYSFDAYLFVLEALEFTKTQKRKARTRSRGPRRASGTYAHHVTGAELCHGARSMALQHYGLMAMALLGIWGIRSTSDIGEIVYNLIAAGDLEKTPSDSRSDFDNVYDFETAFRREYVLALDDVA
jgi:uncharacterized repeat protein (TIGR04138 family)